MFARGTGLPVMKPLTRKAQSLDRTCDTYIHPSNNYCQDTIMIERESNVSSGRERETVILAGSLTWETRWDTIDKIESNWLNKQSRRRKREKKKKEKRKFSVPDIEFRPMESLPPVPGETSPAGRYWFFLITLSDVGFTLRR